MSRTHRTPRTSLPAGTVKQHAGERPASRRPRPDGLLLVAAVNELEFADRRLADDLAAACSRADALVAAGWRQAWVRDRHGVDLYTTTTPKEIH